MFSHMTERTSHGDRLRTHYAVSAFKAEGWRLHWKCIKLETGTNWDTDNYINCNECKFYEWIPIQKFTENLGEISNRGRGSTIKAGLAASSHSLKVPGDLERRQNSGDLHHGPDSSSSSSCHSRWEAAGPTATGQGRKLWREGMLAGQEKLPHSSTNWPCEPQAATSNSSSKEKADENRRKSWFQVILDQPFFLPFSIFSFSLDFVGLSNIVC